MYKKSKPSLQSFDRPQTRLEAAKQALADEQAAAGNPKLLKPTNQYDLMMYEVFSSNEDNNNNQESSSDVLVEKPESEAGQSDDNNKDKSRKRFPIMEPETGRICKHNLATIPLLKGIDEETKSSKDGEPRPSNSVASNNLIEAKNRFRVALKTRAKELGMVVDQGVPKKRQTPKRSASKRKSRGPNSLLSSSKCEPKQPKSNPSEPKMEPTDDATSFDTIIPFCGSNIIIFDRAVPSVFVYKKNVPKYRDKLDILAGKSDDTKTSSVSPYQIGRMWADEHFPRAFKQKVKVRPPPYHASLADPGGPYYEYENKDLGINYLPPPTPAPMDPETNFPINLRIPEALRNGGPQKEINESLPEEINMWADKSAKELLSLHRPRWLAVRKMHVEAERQNASRYRHSFAVLEQMYLARWQVFPLMELFRRPAHEDEDGRVKEEVKVQEVKEVIKEGEKEKNIEVNVKEEAVPEANLEIEIEMEETNNEDIEIITGEDQVDNFIEPVEGDNIVTDDLNSN